MLTTNKFQKKILYITQFNLEQLLYLSKAKGNL